MTFYQLATAGVLSIALLTACSSDNDSPTPGDSGLSSIVDTAVADGRFTTLVAALQATELDATLADESRKFTVFAPTDDAFDALGQETIQALLADTEKLSNILLYHVLADSEVSGEAATAAAGTSIKAANGQNLNVSLDGMRLFINESEVIIADVAASNGVIHVIDKVLQPSDPAPSNDDVDAPTLNIVETAIGAGNFTTLAAALEAADLVSVLADPDATYTVFAPTDAAFAELGDETISALLADPDTLKDILLYHVISDQAVNAETAISLAGNTVEMANGDETALTLDEGRLRINQANVTDTDIFATNGVIHVIDSVLTPPENAPADNSLSDIVQTARNAGSFTTLIQALEATGLNNTLADENATFTVFAPTDDAFAKLGEDTINALLGDVETLTQILTYHVVPNAAVDATTALSLDGQDVDTVNGESIRLTVNGDTLLVNTSQVIQTDIQATNGIIHVIDTVLMPPQAAMDPGSDAELVNIIETARAAGNFSTLLAAIDVADLTDTLSHGGDRYTVFAPTDEAINALGQETIDALLADPMGLRNILLYHVIAGTEVNGETAAASTGVAIGMANGDSVMLSARDDGLYINDSRITATDIRASNGIIHVIDAVLLPPM